MKAITLWQPWATLIAIGAKKVETRSWPTRYRGEIAIHAAKRKPRPLEVAYILEECGLSCKFDGLDVLEDYPLGAIVATARLVDCKLMDDPLIARQTPDELACGNWEQGRFAWCLEDIQPCEPYPIRGFQGLWDLPSDAPPLLNGHG